MFLTISTASAEAINNNSTQAEISNNAITTSHVEVVSDEQSQSTESNVLGSSEGNEILSDSDNTKSYTDLYELLRSSKGTVTLYDDYKYNESTDTIYSNGINISVSNFIFNGNGHTIDANGHSLFSITGNNYTIQNLNIINIVNTNTQYGIYWAGDDGKLININAYNFTITGAGTTDGYALIYWDGNNGLIENSKFHNGTANDTSLPKYDTAVITSYGSDVKIQHSSFWDINGQCIAFTPASTSNIVYKSNFTNITSPNCGIITGRRSAFTVDYCRLINNTLTEYSGDNMIIFARGDYTVKNTYFENNTCGRILNAIFQVDNCTFVNNKASDVIFISYSSETNAGGVINNSHFINETSIILKAGTQGSIDVDGQHIAIYNSNFTNCSNSAYLIAVNSKDSFVMDNCYFYKNEGSENLIKLSKKNNNTIISNCKFEENTVTGDSVLSITANDNYGYVNLDGTTYKDNKNSTSTVNVVNAVYKFFTPKNIIYASVNGGGDGNSPNSTVTLTEALNSIMYGGTIYLANGIYNLDTDINLYCNLIGESKENVILNNSVINEYLYSGKIINITNTKSIMLYSNNVEVNNVTFENSTENVLLYFSSGFAFNFKIYNIIIKNYIYTGKNSNDYHGVILRVGTNNDDLSNVDIQNISIENSNFVSLVKVITNIKNTIKNVTIKNSEFKTLIKNNNPQGKSLDYGNFFKDFTVEDFIIENCNITNMLFWGYNHQNVKNYKINNITIHNSNYTSQNPLFNITYNTILSNITLENINITNNNIDLIKLNNIGNKINVLSINNNKLNSIINSDYEYILTNLTLKDMNLTKSIPTYSGMSFSGFNFTNVKFTDGEIFTLYGGSSLTHSYFNNFTGHIIVQGDGAYIIDSSFIKGNNTIGGALYVNGSLLRLTRSNFTSNNASYGGAIYFTPGSISPVIRDSNFTSNIATVHGGALAFNATKGTNVTITHDDNWNGINNNTNQENGVWSNDCPISNLVGVLYIAVNGTGQGTSPDDPTTLIKGYAKAGGDCKFWFVYKGQIFNTDDIPGLFMTNFAGWTFYGNDTILVCGNIIITPGNGNVEIYNISFVNVTGGAALDIQEDNVLIDNCKFINTSNTNNLYGGAVLVNASNVNITNSEFINNTLTKDESCGGAVYVNGSQVNIIGNNFYLNTATDGSHIYVSSDLIGISIEHNNFVNGTSLASSSVVLQGGESFTINNNTFTNNTGRQGGALTVDGTFNNIQITDNTFINNTADVNGGALYLSLVESKSAQDWISGNIFINNTARLDGGALVINKLSSGSGNIFFTNNNFTGNNASYGGALFIGVDDLKLNLINIFNSNNASYGGAVFINGANTQLTGNFTGNNATYGGAVFVNGSGVSILYSNFTSNSAIKGGAVYINGTNTVIRNSEFTGNIANATNEAWGSAIYIDKSKSLAVYGVTLTNNHARNKNATDGHGDIALDDNALIYDYGLILLDTPGYQQYIINVSNIRYATIYVSDKGTGTGLDPKSPIAWDNISWKDVEQGAVVVLVGNVTVGENYNNLTNRNVTINGKKYTIISTGKYLFTLGHMKPYLEVINYCLDSNPNANNHKLMAL